MIQSYYRHVATAVIGGRVINYPPMTIQAETRFGASGRLTELKLFNVADATVKACEPKGGIHAEGRLVAGYESMSGLVAVGNIMNYQLERSGVDRILTVKIVDALVMKKGLVLNLSYSGTVMASQVIRDVAGFAGLIVQRTPPVEKTFTNGYSLSGLTVETAFINLARETGTVYYSNNGNVEFVDPRLPSMDTILLTPETGLLEVKPSKGGYTIRSLYQHRIGYNVSVQVQSPSFNGRLKAKKGRLNFNSQGGSLCEFEAVMA